MEGPVSPAEIGAAPGGQPAGMSPSLRAPDLAAAQELARNSDSALVLLVSSDPAVLKAAARAIAQQLDWRAVDLNRDLTQRLLPYSPSERVAEAWDALQAIVGEHSKGVVVTSTDVLFEPSLGYRPYEALRRLGRRGPMVAAWLGTVDGRDIVRAEPGHPEYVRAKLDVPFVLASDIRGTAE